MKTDNENPLLDIGGVNDAPVSPGVAVAALALNFAMKYHDINTVQDGVLYQQYKMEGKNMMPLHLDMVFETAERFERHIMGAPNRLSSMILDAVVDVIENGATDEEDGDTAAETPD